MENSVPNTGEAILRTLVMIFKIVMWKSNAKLFVVNIIFIRLT